MKKLTITAKKKACGRKRLPEGTKAESRSVTLFPWEWDALAAADPDGRATLEAQKRLRESIAAATREATHAAE